MSEEANKKLLRRHYEDIVNLNNLHATEDQMAEDFIGHAAPPGMASRARSRSPGNGGLARSDSRRAASRSTR